MDIPSDGVPAASDAGLTTHPTLNSSSVTSPGFESSGFDSPGFDSPGFDSPGFDSPGSDSPGFQSPGLDADPAVTTDHLRRLWEAGGRSITVTYDEQAVRHRAYLAHPRTDI